MALRALAGRHVHDDGALAHGLHHLGRHQRGRGTARDQRSGDHHIGSRHALGHFGLLAIQPALRHGTGITAHAFGGFALFIGFVGYVNELGTQRFDLLLHARTHIGGLDHGTEALGGGNRLQAGHAHAQNHHAGGLDGTGSGHQHGEEAWIVLGRQHHGLVAGNVGLAGQHVHALRAGGTRCGFQCEGGQAGSGQALQPFGIERIQHADQHGAGAHLRQLFGLRGAHFQHHFAAECRGGIGQAGTSGFELGIGDAGSQSGTVLHQQRVTLTHEFFHGFRRGRYSRLASHRFQWNSNLHFVSLMVAGQAGHGMPHSSAVCHGVTGCRQEVKRAFQG